MSDEQGTPGVPGLPGLASLLENMSERFHQQQTELAEVRRQIEDSTTTVSSERHVVTVTVGPRGELTELTLASPDYKRLSAKELSALIVDTTQRARSQAVRKVQDLLAPTLPPGLSIEGLAEGRVDLAKTFPEQLFDTEALNAFLGRVRNASSRPTDE